MGSWKKKKDDFLVVENTTYNLNGTSKRVLKKDIEVYPENENETLAEAAKLKVDLYAEQIETSPIQQNQSSNIAVLQVKKNITVKELAELYNISKTSQQNYRSRLYDPLPYHQKVKGGKITYIVEEVEKWLKNQHR
ncbi:helix-turn-helix domain-containing protein [Sulfurimonas sp. ST-27]|uniref:helix-turn-helix domain-containing protein n=1 Tax=Sulfurimonas sp. ST-27 TaxID=3400152 RepID=UPI003AB7400A